MLALIRVFALTPWLLNLATRSLARNLNVPEPLLQTTGEFVFAQVRAVENRVCPVRLLRQLVSWLRSPAR
jgi:hypothetical protein